MFKRPMHFIGPREQITPEDEALLREIQGLPHWSAIMKVHGNIMQDVRDEIVDGQEIHPLDGLARFAGTVNTYATERPKPETSTLM